VITRLLDMGTAPHLIAATLRGVLAQRLLRRLCPQCSERYAPTETERALLGYPETDFLQRGRGCADCAGTGYKGRMGIYEYFNVEEDIHRLILDRASPYAIRYAAKRAGMLLMADYARRAVLAGETTVAEIQRVVLSDAPQEQLCPHCQRVVNVDFSVCPYCQTTLKETCGGCGRPVEANWESCPACGKHLEREWEKVYCRHCLAPVRPEWESCHFCGGAIR
jgi:RNA polymerase subunit RPABC4/transcription elongation factor Spt4